MKRVKKAEYLCDYTIDLVFSDGILGVIDLKDTILKDSRPIFKDLADLAKFRDFKVDLNTLVWSNGLDLAPEYLYENLQRRLDPVEIK